MTSPILYVYEIVLVFVFECFIHCIFQLSHARHHIILETHLTQQFCRQSRERIFPSWQQIKFASSLFVYFLVF